MRKTNSSNGFCTVFVETQEKKKDWTLALKYIETRFWTSRNPGQTRIMYKEDVNSSIVNHLYKRHQ